MVGTSCSSFSLAIFGGELATLRESLLSGELLLSGLISGHNFLMLYLGVFTFGILQHAQYFAIYSH